MSQFQITIHDERGSVIDEFGFSAGELLIGRAENNDIVLPSSAVSRRHARLVIEGSNCMVEDLGSSNGVLLSGRKLQGLVALPDDVSLVVGNYALHVRRASGALVAPSQPPAKPHIHDASRTGVAYLVRVDAEATGVVFPIRAPEATVGRADNNTVPLQAEGVSRLHSTFRVRGTQWTLVDNNSANGTFLNGRRVAQPIVVREGDELRMGMAAFVFTYDPARVDPYRSESADATRTQMMAVQSATSRSPLPFVAVGLVVVIALVASITVVVHERSQRAGLAAGSNPATSHASEGTEDRFGTLLERAQSAIEGRDWATAQGVLVEAAALRPDSDRVRRLRAQSDEGMTHFQRFEECQSKVEAGTRLEMANQPLAAAETFGDALACLRELPAASPYREEGGRILQQRVLPSLIALHRFLANQAVQSNDFDAATQSLRFALELQGQRQDDDSGAREGIQRQLRNTYLQAGDTHHDRRRWQRVIDAYEAAHALQPLDTGRQTRLEHARRQLR